MRLLRAFIPVPLPSNIQGHAAKHSKMTLDELLNEYEELEDWEEQCDFLIDLGFELPEFPEAEKNDANIVRGCQSRVWLTADLLADNSDEPHVRLQADSDAIIVKGLIAVLLAAYNGRTVSEVLAFDIQGLFTRMGLDQHLSPTRKNGLRGMVQRIRDIAASSAA